MGGLSGEEERRVGEVLKDWEVKKEPRLLAIDQQTGLITGDDLLSQDLSSHYHRRARVSLPGSEWDRVVPPCYGHQKPTFAFCFRILTSRCH